MRPAEVLGDPFAALARSLLVADADLPEAEQGRPPALPDLSASDFPRADDLTALLAHADESALKPILSTFTGIEQTVREKEGYERTVKVALLLVVDQLDEYVDLIKGDFPLLNVTRADAVRQLLAAGIEAEKSRLARRKK